MADNNAAQLKLRAAFRQGYFAFFAVVLILCLMLGWASRQLGVQAFTFADARIGSLLPLIGALGIGLIVPLFFGTWVVATRAILRRDPRTGHSK